MSVICLCCAAESSCIFIDEFIFLKQKCPQMVTKMVHKIFIPMLIVISYLALKFVSFILTSCCVHTLHFTSERQNIKAYNCSKCTKFPSFLIVDHMHKRRNFCRRPSYFQTRGGGGPMEAPTLDPGCDLAWCDTVQTPAGLCTPFYSEREHTRGRQIHAPSS